MTDDERRPDPDALLAAIQKEETEEQRGKLKIFFGMAAGVGKTYAMLEAAQKRRAEGLDVVIGYVETHGRAETDVLAEGLEIIPRVSRDYRGTVLEEMDIDAVLARRPQLALVDELAHTNAPGSRHPKRYQDVLELLDVGIDVYTTVNVQHLESRADAVRRITGVMIRETIPDSILDRANEIELIDLAPEELLKRLAEGKVYTPDRAELAARKFFRMGNLTALREMALRLTAERVDHQLQDYMQVRQIAGPWKSGERLMVAVSPSPLSERLVRWTRRMAYNLEAPWIAVTIEPSQPLSETDRARLSRNLFLARDLGAEVVTTSGDDVVKALMRVAQQRNVTQIVVGKPVRSWFQELVTGGSLVNRLVHASGEVDIYVVTGERTESAEHPAVTSPPLHSRWSQYILAVLIVCLVTVINLTAYPLIGYRAVALSLLFTVLLLAAFVGRGPSLVAAALSAVLWNFLFIPPRFTFLIANLEDVMIFIMYFSIALVTGGLTARIRGQAESAQRRAEQTQALNTLAREIASAVTMDGVLQSAVKQIGQVFDADVAFLLAGSADRLSAGPHPASTLALTEKEWSVATWAFDNGKTAGRFTDTLPMAEAMYLPLRTPSGVVGVMGIKIRSAQRLPLDQEALFQTFVSQVSLVIERQMLDEKAQRAAVLQESERLYATLLDSISHELRTPLAAISGATSSLLDPHIGDDPAAKQALGEDIQDATERLNRLVDNLLDMTRLESGKLNLNLEWCDVADLVNVSVGQVEKQLSGYELIVDIAPDLPLARLDFVLMQQVLVNLLHNAAVHTPPGTRVRVTAKADGQDLLLCVADRGPGLPPNDLTRVFDKFYRAPGTASGGTGLGLSICRGLVEAHRGTITAENRTNGGARFVIRLPLARPPDPPQEAAHDD
jgi:two-component system sensor histidine kinase KdpD